MSNRLERVGRSSSWAGRFVGVCGALALLAALLSASPLFARAGRAAPKVSEAAGPPLKTYGSKDAPITLETFSDFQCPSCRAFYEETLRPMINDYVASGKVYVVHRDFPLAMHKYGYEAARWANAAARIGDFPQVEAALYDNQDSWGENGDIQKYVASAMSASDFKRVEKLMQGCTDQASQNCQEDSYINSDRSIGMQIPVQATPTFVIFYKGRKISSASGVVSWTILRQFFDQLLRQG